MTTPATPSQATPPTGPPPVVRAAWVKLPPPEAFAVFTDEIGAWWPLPTHGLFGQRAGGLVFRNECLIEQAVDGSEEVWGRVLSWEPAERIVLSWHPGRSGDDASEIEVTFNADGTGTRVIIEHRGWERFGSEAIDRQRQYMRPNAWGYVLDHYADGTEARTDRNELQELAAAYDRFFAEATNRGFSPPHNGGWTAEQVVAHVALNDAAMITICHALVHGGYEEGDTPRFANSTCQDPEVLDRWVKACENWDGLVERGRTSSRQLMAALARLSPDQRATAVHCHLTHDGETMIDAPRPWGAVAIDVQAGVHLPAHIEQLNNLRA